MLNCLCRTRGFPKALFIDLLVLVLHMVRKIWRETDRIKAGKNFKVTQPKFSNVTALNGLAKFYCIIVSADRTLQIYATICIFQIRNSRKENPQKLTQLSSRSHPRHLVGKRTAQKDTIIDITSDSQVNSNFPYRWSPASLTFNNYFYLFLYLYIT